MKALFNKIKELKQLVDEQTLYYFIVPVTISLGISGAYLAVLFYEFVIKDLRL